MIRENAVGPFQRNAAMKVWSSATMGGTHCGSTACAPILCRSCATAPAQRCRCSIDASGSRPCRVRLPRGRQLPWPAHASQKKLYKLMEDVAYLYRSIYVDIFKLAQVLPAEPLLVLPSEALFADKSRPSAMAAFAAFLGVPADGPAVNSKVSSASPAATDGSPHENGAPMLSPPPLRTSRRRFVRGCAQAGSCGSYSSGISLLLCGGPRVRRRRGCAGQWRPRRARTAVARSSTGGVHNHRQSLESYFTHGQTREFGQCRVWALPRHVATQRAAFVAFPAAASYTHSYYTVAYELCHDG